MGLKVKLGLLLTSFVIIPIFILGTIQGYDQYKLLMKQSQNSLRSNTLQYIQTTRNLFYQISQDIDFISGMNEIEKVLSALEDEDPDEIEFWTESFGLLLQTFMSNRKTFSQIRLVNAKDNHTIIGSDYKDDKATLSVETPDYLVLNATITSPVAKWNMVDSKPKLFIFFPITTDNVTTYLAFNINLHHFTALIKTGNTLSFTDLGVKLIGDEHSQSISSQLLGNENSENSETIHSIKLDDLFVISGQLTSQIQRNKTSHFGKKTNHTIHG